MANIQPAGSHLRYPTRVSYLLIVSADGGFKQIILLCLSNFSVLRNLQKTARMGKQKYTPQFFKITELQTRLCIADLLADHRAMVTYNQLMKSEDSIKYIMVFDEKDVEIPCLVAYSRHFGICLLKLSSEEVAEVQGAIKHARMVCIPAETELCKIIDKKLEHIKSTEIAIDLSKAGLE